MKKLYRQVTLTDDQRDEFVFPHKIAMTGEDLHSKSEIAYELGLRDKRIAELEKKGKILYIEGQLEGVECVEIFIDGYYASCIVAKLVALRY